MRCSHHRGPEGDRARREACDSGRVARFLRRWFLANTLVAGASALLWLILRSGSKPSRLAYPCQQAALSAATLAFGSPLVASVLALRRVLARRVFSPGGLALAALGLLITAGAWSYLSRADDYRGPMLSPPTEYRAQVFHVTDCPQDPVGDRFPGLDDLIEMMGGHGLKLYRSDTESLVAGPEGIVGADDVVVVKINYQWAERGGTNTDLLRGLIRRLVDHPDVFTGEVVVVENAQFASTSGLDRAENNAQDISQSPHDVVAHFQAEGHRVSHFDWTLIRYESVGEYDTGDMNDGYVVYPFEPTLFGAVSYPKFETDLGTRISLKNGIWDGSSYDRGKLRFINLPVLKSHHSTYGATACVKHYMGVVTTELSTYSHFAMGNGLLGALIGEIGLADLNILDATWINADPNTGPATTYEGATRRDELVASLDPVAADIWAVKHILIPGFLANGFTPPWPEPSADPDDPTSDFRVYLDRSMNEILDAGLTVTNDPAQIDEIDLAPPGEASQPGGGGAPFTVEEVPGGYQLGWSAPVRGGPVVEYNLYRTDLLAGAGPALPLCEAALGTGTTAFLPTLPDNHGFLVVARNGVSDGSLGSDSEGRERPLGSACP